MSFWWWLAAWSITGNMHRLDSALAYSACTGPARGREPQPALVAEDFLNVMYSHPYGTRKN